MTITTIKIRGGNKVDLPLSAEERELLITSDTGELFYGMGEGSPIRQIGGGHVPDKDLTDQVNGVTNIFNVGEAYRPGTLVVYFCLARLRKTVGVNIYDVVELDAEAGTFELPGRLPVAGDTLIVEYHRKIYI